MTCSCPLSHRRFLSADLASLNIILDLARLFLMLGGGAVECKQHIAILLEALTRFWIVRRESLQEGVGHFGNVVRRLGQSDLIYIITPSPTFAFALSPGNSAVLWLAVAKILTRIHSWTCRRTPPTVPRHRCLSEQRIYIYAFHC